MDNFKVAIDGPAGSGKSSISSIISEKLGFTHIDTGAMYRAITLEALKRKIDINNENEYDFLNEINIIYKDGKTYLNDKDVSEDIRKEDVTNNTSTVASIKKVRDKMLLFQRESAKFGKIIMDGRDIGTVVLPDANLKIFLTADAKVRAKRRCIENEQKGIESDYNTILNEIKLRDYKDSHREIAPLKKASDAIMLDTSNLTIDEVVNKIIDLIEKRDNMSDKEVRMEDWAEYSKKYKPGDKVTGTVVSISDDKTILLDIKSFTEGTMHLDHYTNDKSITSFKGLVNIGDEIVCQVTSVKESQILLSRQNEIKNENFNELVKFKENDEAFEAYITKEIKGGYNLSYKGIQLFMPKSQSLNDTKLKTNVFVKIIELDEKRNKAVVSAKAYEHELYIEKRDKQLEGISVGDKLDGVITKVEKYAAFVKIGDVIGVIKARDVAHEFVDITTVLKAGDNIKVEVLGKENGKLQLSRKALIETSYDLFKKEHKIGDVVKGKLTNKLPFGLLIELAPNLKGLLHSNEYSHNPNDNYNNCVVIGDEIEAAIIKFDDEGQKISLSRKALMDNPWDKVDAKIGDTTNVKVLEVGKNGLKVLAYGVEGFVPLSETMVEFDKKLADYYAKDDEAQAVVIDINKKEWKLKLSIKKAEDEKEKELFQKYLKNEEVSTSIGEQFEEVLKK